ncbi:hypothetical protein KY290_031149 [Solanum tuberosum]|uniref:Uncharacterized protein n=1 Tax=Solanum tuberosum TaxID=4113 RepID=A0ABQ7U8B2_SOLTU|nr:hypothetical protein KY290_031149 [Solanum tuberosum]
MAFYVPLYLEAQVEARLLMFSHMNLLSPVSGAFKHPKYAGIENDIAFLIENFDSIRKMNLFKFFFPKKSHSDRPTSHLLKKTLPAVRRLLVNQIGYIYYLLNFGLEGGAAKHITSREGSYATGDRPVYLVSSTRTSRVEALLGVASSITASRLANCQGSKSSPTCCGAFGRERVGVIQLERIRSRHPLLLARTAPRRRSRSAGPLRSTCLCLLLPTVGPPSPKGRKRSRNKRLSSPYSQVAFRSSPGPVVPQLLPWLLPTGIPHSGRLLGRSLGPKLYTTGMVPIDSLLQRRYRTLQAEHLFLVYRSTPRRGMCTSSNNKNETIGSYARSISGYRSNHLNFIWVRILLRGPLEIRNC